MDKANFLTSKKFAAIALAMGIMGGALKLIAIFTYENHLSREYPALLSGWNNLAFFTYTTNILVDFWLLFLALSILFNIGGVTNFLTRASVQGFVTVMIFTVGFMYCGVLFWFDELYSRGLWWGNFVTFWHHAVTPAFMVFLFFRPADRTKLSTKSLLLWLLYPLAYLGFTMARGAKIAWHPYPFLNLEWEMFADFNLAPGLGVALSIAFLFLFILSVSFLAVKIHNRIAGKQSGDTTKQQGARK